MTEQSIAHYRISGKIGEGGMGEVYRATDTKLKRDVALKILPNSLSEDADRMARFGREAQLLASLNHPNIASIYGLEDSDGKQVLVMELVEGETLAERIQRGPIPLDEALVIAKQIAEALEEAHESGIIHRDLKPANVKLSPTEAVKLLDFGLAKALEDEAGKSSSQDLSQSPTLSALATKAGLILGTAGYMSPEQARGQKVDRRADIWSYGVVLYEMLSGKQAFTGDTVTDVLAAVLRSDLDWSTLPDEVPSPIRQLVRRCLERNPKQRLQSIGDARITIEEYQADPAREGERGVAVPPVVSRPSLWRRALPWSLLAVIAILTAGLGVAIWGTAPEPPLRLNIAFADQPLFLGLGANAVLSPDGTRLAYAVGNDASRTLYIRSLEQLEGTSLASGNSGATAPYHPFFSPDGQWLGYVTSTELRKVSITGGTSLTLCRVERSRGATWGPDDTIVFAPSPNSSLYRVRAAGGEPEQLTTLDEEKNEATHRWPQMLPGGKAVLFTSHTQPAGGFDKANLEVVSLVSGERKVIVRGGSNGRYVPSGHIVYVNEGSLLAVPFDLDDLEVSGAPAPVVQDVSWSVTEGGAQFSFSQTGRFAYLKGDNTLPEYPVVWADPKGSIATLWNERGSYANPRLSPDGKKLALTVLRNGNWDIWIYDLERSVSTRLTFDEASDTEQVWSPDGQYVVFSSDRHGADNLYRKRADGSGDLERLTEGTAPQWASSMTRDGRFLIYMQAGQSFDLWVLPLDGDREPEVFLNTTFSEADGDFSPDGNWLAYDSNESGRSEVYVRPFPMGGGKWQVSDGGGAYPRWSRDGRRLYYRSDEGLMVASVEAADGTFQAGKAKSVLEGAYRGGTGGLSLAGNSFADYDVAPDGRFVMFPGATEAQRGEHPHLTLVTQWFDDLRRTFGNTME
jgi:serine/threonine-protein kinase